MGVATNIIYEPMSMVTGGFSGVGIILHALFRIPVWITTVLLNIPLFLLARKTHGKHFLIQSLFAMLSFSLTLAFVPIVSIAEKDYLRLCWEVLFMVLVLGWFLVPEVQREARIC